MAKYLIDANLPFRLSIWQGKNFIHQFSLGDTWSDERIWDYAKESRLTIVTKDSDFSNRIIMSAPPPKIIHLRIGNMKLKGLDAFITQEWNKIVECSEN